MTRPYCERCGTIEIPLLRANAKWDGREHVYCPACWRISWPVQQSQADEDYELHDAHMRAAAQELPPDVARAIGRPLKGFPSYGRMPSSGAWTLRCGHEGCVRTALYKSATCIEHEVTTAQT